MASRLLSHSRWLPLGLRTQRVSRSNGRPLSTATSWKSRSASVVQMIKNDPFVKLSLSLFVIVLGGTAALEVYNKFKKRTSRAARVFPPTFGHYAVRRTALVNAIDTELASGSNDSSCPIVYIAGPKGSGKTQLLHQFSHHFLDSRQHKWLGLKHVDPMVIYLDATSTSSLSLSVAAALTALGIKEEDTFDHSIESLMKYLALQQVPWLLMVDGDVYKDVSGSSVSAIWSHVKSCTTDCGSLLITSTEPSSSTRTVNISPRFGEDEAVELLSCYGGMESSDGEEQSLLQSLHCHPLSTALAAATITAYKELWHFDSHKAVNLYLQLLQNKLEGEQSPLQVCLDLYCEVVFADTRMRHVFDLLGAVDVNVPVMTALISEHIQHSFYNIPRETLVSSSVLIPPEESPDSVSYWDYFKSIKESLFPSTPAAPVRPRSDDTVAFLRHSPLLSFNSSFMKDFELVSMHSSAMSYVREQFATHTCTSLDEDHYKTKEAEFQQSSWLRRYRTFSKDECLASYHRSLPGLSSPGVPTARQFASAPSPSSGNVSRGTAVCDNVSYSQYVHIVSHCHRVLKSLTNTLQNCVGDIPVSVLQGLMIPQLQLLKEYPLLAEADKVTAQILEADTQALSLSQAKLEPHLLHYERLVNKQKVLLGSTDLTVSSNLTKYADMLLSSGRPSEACAVLQGVLGTYKNLSSGMRDQLCVEIGHAMSSLGQAYAQLGEHQNSKDWFEHALASFQTVPEQGGEVTNKQRKLISASLIDIAQAYLILGDLPVAKKYSELACMVLDSIHPEGNSETVRCLKIGSIVNALGGDKEESIKQKTRASKIEGHL